MALTISRSCSSIRVMFGEQMSKRRQGQCTWAHPTAPPVESHTTPHPHPLELAICGRGYLCLFNIDGDDLFDRHAHFADDCLGIKSSSNKVEAKLARRSLPVCLTSADEATAAAGSAVAANMLSRNDSRSSSVALVPTTQRSPLAIPNRSFNRRIKQPTSPPWAPS